MTTLFAPDTPAIVTCLGEEPRAVQLAVQDMLHDLAKVSGMQPISRDTLPEGKPSGIMVGTLSSPVFAAFLRDCEMNTADIAGKWEQYILATCGDALLIIGSDMRGTIWGVYELCSRFLQVDPAYLWTDHEPRAMQSLCLDKVYRTDGPGAYRFRGWFINDEDLLEGFSYQGVPPKGYDFHAEYAPALAMIIETALRMKQNMLIPCSHLDIDNPAEENLVRMVTERGLYISMHHQEPVGVHQKTMDRYWQGSGTENINFVDHPDKYQAVWRHYIGKWAKYPGVIWQLGLRGRGDRPVWYQNSRVPQTIQARGELISKAIQMQHALIVEATGTADFLSSSTLWMEGMPLYKAGALTFPERTMIVLSDFGPDQMWAEEYYETPRIPGRGYGVYYHVCFWGCGPHLVQGNRPEKIGYNYRNAIAMGDTQYSVLNVSNIHEHVCGIACVAQMTWDMECAEPETFLQQWCRSQYDEVAGEEAADLYRNYYDGFAHMDDSRIPGRMLFMDGMTKHVAQMLMRIVAGDELQAVDIQNKRLFSFPDTDRFIQYYQAVTEDGIRRFERVQAQAQRLLPRIPADRRGFFCSNLVLQTETILGLYRWVLCLTKAAQNRRAHQPNENYTLWIDAAINALESIADAREMVTYGKWRHWYDGDTLIDLPGLLTQTIAMHITTHPH